MAALVAAVLFMGMQRPARNSLIIQFKNFVGDNQLRLDSQIYTNALGQNFTVTNFKYYVGRISLVKSNGQELLFPDYYLIKEDDDATKKMVWDNIPDGEYTSLRFIIGVDSLHNCSGAQSGALDPVNAMFWTWNTGYIFMKLEGKSPASKSPGNIFEYHIGGYKGEYNCIRKVQLDFKQAPLVVSSGKAVHINIKADASELLKTPTTVDFEKLSSVTDFHNSTTIADNYMDMFSIINIQQ